MLTLPQGRPPRIENLENQNIEISLIDFCANYQPISTKFSEIFYLAEE